MGLEEHPVDCPCCGACFIALVDPGEAGSDYIQDCKVCCRPIRFHLRVGADGLIELHTACEGS